ncbi:MAG TPA: HNH endonuclease [bacterium]|nr:HNH endonuclease [bacterium]HRQ70310.1 HNH endonuclease [bacterium]
MRIIKLSTDESKHFQNKEDVLSFFSEDLLSREEKGKFRIPKGALDEKKFKEGEKLFFSYNKEILFTAISKSDKLPNYDKHKKKLPFYFTVDTDTLKPISGLTLDDLEKKIRKIIPGKNIVQSEGWPYLEDNKETDKLWNEIVSGRRSSDKKANEEGVNQEERAYRAWNILYEVAKKKSTITYGELSRKLNLTHHRPCRFFLELIQNYCLENKMPPLTILVVNQRGKPGEGFTAWDIDDYENGIKKVFENAGLFKTNPFMYADKGETIEDLSERHFNGELSDKKVYSYMSVRGAAQNYFKSLMKRVYKNKCAFCGLDIEEALQAAHIVAWSDCKGEKRVSPENGILLCANHHLLFDKGILSLDENYKIIPGLKGKEKNKFIEEVLGKKCSLPDNEKHYPSKGLIKKKNDKLSRKKDDN